jgi:adenylosuccinate lyase
MRANLDVGGGLAYSQNVPLALIDAGLERNAAYALVQAASARAWDEGASFRDELAANADVTSRVALGPLFDPARPLRNLDVVFDRLEKIEVAA